MALIKIKQINNTPAAEGAVVLFDGSNNVWSNNDDGAIQLSSGATGSRPVSPVNGHIRYNTTLNCVEAYVNGSWVCTNVTNGSALGRMYQMNFFYAGAANNKWLDNGHGSMPSDETNGIIPWTSELMGISFAAKTNSGDTDIKIYATPEGVEPSVTQTLKFTLSLTNKRIARKTNFSPRPTFSPGDKIGVFTATTGDTTTNPAVILYFNITANTSAESSDTTSEFMT